MYQCDKRGLCAHLCVMIVCMCVCACYDVFQSLRKVRVSCVYVGFLKIEKD